MLREIKSIRHINNETQKRWFIDADMDLRIWLRDSVPTRFELNYNRSMGKYVLLWNQEDGFRHKHILSSDETRAPTLPFLAGDIQRQYIIDDDFDYAEIARKFLRASEHIEVMLADFIYARLMEHPGPFAIHPVTRPAPTEY